MCAEPDRREGSNDALESSSTTNDVAFFAVIANIESTSLSALGHESDDLIGSRRRS